MVKQASHHPPTDLGRRRQCYLLPTSAPRAPVVRADALVIHDYHHGAASVFHSWGVHVLKPGQPVDSFVLRGVDGADVVLSC
uniref:Uncharacterized protein n=1 Tax=Arundo donax TaxID=35708 RepID=A0A0A9EUK9_ARUDO